MPAGRIRQTNPERLEARIAQRDQRLHDLGFATYADYIRSPGWTATRAKYRASKLPQDCQLCGATKPIILHHRTYDRIGCEQPQDLAPLCPACHNFVHGLEASGYTDSLDPEKVQALVDQSRQRTNRASEGKRRERQRGEYRPNQGAHAARRLGKALGWSLTTALMRAAENHADVADEVAQIRELIEGVRQK